MQLQLACPFREQGRTEFPGQVIVERNQAPQFRDDVPVCGLKLGGAAVALVSAFQQLRISIASS